MKYGFKGGEIGSFTQYCSGAPYTSVLGAQLAARPGIWFFFPSTPPAPAACPQLLPHRPDGQQVHSQQLECKYARALRGTSNVLNTRNVSSYSYSADYTQANPEYFQRRFLYFGAVVTLQ